MVHHKSKELKSTARSCNMDPTYRSFFTNSAEATDLRLGRYTHDDGRLWNDFGANGRGNVTYPLLPVSAINGSSTAAELTPQDGRESEGAPTLSSQMGDLYVDYALVSDEDLEILEGKGGLLPEARSPGETLARNKITEMVERYGSGKNFQYSGGRTTFPAKLMQMLDCGEVEDIIKWKPHGRAFQVIDSKVCAEKLLPRFFKQTKWASFVRQLNLWGFKRLTSGVDAGAYYHEMFLRGRYNLVMRLRRQKNKGARSQLLYPMHEPNLYKVLPMPELVDSSLHRQSEGAVKAIKPTSNEVLKDALVESKKTLPEVLPVSVELDNKHVLASEKEDKAMDQPYAGAPAPPELKPKARVAPTSSHLTDPLTKYESGLEALTDPVELDNKHKTVALRHAGTPPLPELKPDARNSNLAAFDNAHTYIKDSALTSDREKDLMDWDPNALGFAFGPTSDEVSDENKTNDDKNIDWAVASMLFDSSDGEIKRGGQNIVWSTPSPLPDDPIDEDLFANDKTFDWGDSVTQDDTTKCGSASAIDHQLDPVPRPFQVHPPTKEKVPVQHAFQGHLPTAVHFSPNMYANMAFGRVSMGGPFINMNNGYNMTQIPPPQWFQMCQVDPMAQNTHGVYSQGMFWQDQTSGSNHGENQPSAHHSFHGSSS